MAGNAMCLWTLRGLVSAFFDLAIAYFLLSGAALAYFASIFLRFFGLGLPCPCHQFFGNATLDECWKGCLVNAPFNKVSSVQSSVKNKFPFDSVLGHEHDLDCGSNSKSHDCADERCVDLKSEVSPRSSHEDSRNLVVVEEAESGLESKQVCPGDRFLELCRTAKAHLEKLELDEPLTPPASTVPMSPNNEYDGTDCGFESMVHAVKPRDAKPGEGKPFLEKETTERDFSVGLFRSLSVPDLASCSGKQETVIEILEKALEKEHNSRTALYMELEKERTAAATAAEEAMAMIFRLQEEKAEIEMDARQYHRIIEEKSAYDMEETNILKEIVIRREKEKHYLEKEVEGYKQLLLERERWDGDGFGQMASSVYSSEDSGLMSPWIGELFNDQKEKEVNLDVYINQGLLEKGRTSMEQDVLGNEDPLGIPSESSSHQPVELSECPNTVMKEGEQCERYSSKETKACDEPKIILPYDNHAVVRQRKSMSDFDYERSKIDKEIGWLREGLKGASTKANGTKYQSFPRNGTILNRQTSDSDKTVRLQPFCSSPGTASIDCQRKSMSAFDTERTKIDSEVGWLRERLKLVHEGRGKLKILGGRKEREKPHMQMLDYIASQLRQICHLTQPGKVLKKAALPPLSSNAIQKRRPNKTGSLEVGKIL